MFSKLYKFSKFVMYLNSCSMDLGRDTEAPATSQALPVSMEVPADSHQDAGRGKRVEAPQDKTSDAAPTQSEQVTDHQAPKTKT